MRPAVDREALESARVLRCHFCLWAIQVTDIDRKGDVADAYSRHLTRHGDAAEVATVEGCVWADLVAELER